MLPVCVGVCVCVCKAIRLKGHLSHRPGVGDSYTALLLFWPDLSNPIFHPSSFLFYLALFLSFFTDPGKSQSNPSPLQLGKPWWVLVTPTECSSSMGHPFSASSHSSRSNQPAAKRFTSGKSLLASLHLIQKEYKSLPIPLQSKYMNE